MRQDWIAEAAMPAGTAWHWDNSLTTDYWNPPTSERQHVLAVIIAFILAAILAQMGW